jgi:putative urate catabolism protein
MLNSLVCQDLWDVDGTQKSHYNFPFVSRGNHCMAAKYPYPRDLVGYGRTPPDPQWPGNARLAVQFVINYEEGGENCILHGDAASEAFLSESVGAQPLLGVRNLNMESMYEYGSRAGFWRLHRLFTRGGLPLTVYAVAMAMERNPDAVAAMVEADWEIASHGYRWIDYQYMGADTEREHIRKAVEIHTRWQATRPLGFYQGRNQPHTRWLVVEEGGFLYDADSYADDLPYWTTEFGKPHLIIPYTLDNNDMRFATYAGFNSGDQFFAYLRDAFDTLYAEGQEAPKMMSIGLHCRLAGRPGRTAALASDFLDHVQSHDRVWICRRVDIARHWHEPP